MHLNLASLNHRAVQLVTCHIRFCTMLESYKTESLHALGNNYYKDMYGGDKVMLCSKYEQ